MTHIFKDGFNTRYISEFLKALERFVALALFGPAFPFLVKLSLVKVSSPRMKPRVISDSSLPL